MPKHRQIPWNSVIFNEFIEKAMLTEDEIYIMKSRFADKTRDIIADELCISVSTLDRKIARLKTKYDNACENSDILPVRVL